MFLVKIFMHYCTNIISIFDSLSLFIFFSYKKLCSLCGPTKLYDVPIFFFLSLHYRSLTILFFFFFLFLYFYSFSKCSLFDCSFSPVFSPLILPHPPSPIYPLLCSYYFHSHSFPSKYACAALVQIPHTRL